MTILAQAARLFHRPARPTWHQLWLLRRQRRHLAGLDDRLLEDIGLDRDTAGEEARRAVWDVPRHWRV